jgi:thioredoxin-like negative regulator of GroEL
MSRRRRQLLGWVVGALALVGLALALPSDLVFVLAGVVWGLGLAGFVARGRYGKARALLAQKQYEAAFDELLAFERQVTTDAWRRQLAFLFTGFSTTDPLALARCYQGVVRLEQGRLAEAEALLASAVQQDPGYGLAWANRALGAALAGDAERARAFATTAKQHDVAGPRLDRLIDDALSKPTPKE